MSAAGLVGSLFPFNGARDGALELVNVKKKESFIFNELENEACALKGQ